MAITKDDLDVDYLSRTVEKFQDAEETEYEIVQSINGGDGADPEVGAGGLGDMLVLDSSFNPPTKAHMSIILSSLHIPTTSGIARWDGSSQTWIVPESSEPPVASLQSIKHSRILLLLAVRNVDKAPLPASFADRLAMMTLFAHNLLDLIPISNTLYIPVIDIGIIKHARFLEKAGTLRSTYPNIEEMIFLTGFDTLIRLFDPKYYGGTLEPLAPFFSARNRVRCCFRPTESRDGNWRKQQEKYLEDIKEGKREREGCPREWGKKIELIEHGLDLPISSTLVREAVKSQNANILTRMLSIGVKEWVLGKGLYAE